MITHYTAEVPSMDLTRPELTTFMEMLGFYEIPTDYHDEWPCRWFRDSDSEFQVHVTGGPHLEAPDWGLAHLCVLATQEGFDALRKSAWCVRANPYSELGRIWVAGPGGIRCEVQVGQ